jgi:hypothetical protein
MDTDRHILLTHTNGATEIHTIRDLIKNSNDWDSPLGGADAVNITLDLRAGRTKGKFYAGTWELLK